MHRRLSMFVSMIVVSSGSSPAFADDEQAVKRLQDRGFQVTTRH
jgi:hypothetical protein